VPLRLNIVPAEDKTRVFGLVLVPQAQGLFVSVNTGGGRMNREQKAQAISELAEVLARSNAGVLTNYQGLSTAELTTLRRKLRELGIEYRVVKNTLARFAAERVGREFLAGSFEGATAIAFGYGSEVELAKAVTNYIRSSDSVLAIKGGFLADRLLTREDVSTLATVPPREVLLSQVLAGMQSPIVALVNYLAYPLREAIGILQARIKQLEGE
jgi:large subunit ribosomal protein L10